MEIHSRPKNLGLRLCCFCCCIQIRIPNMIGIRKTPYLFLLNIYSKEYRGLINRKYGCFGLWRACFCRVFLYLFPRFSSSCNSNFLPLSNPKNPTDCPYQIATKIQTFQTLIHSRNPNCFFEDLKPKMHKFF